MKRPWALALLTLLTFGACDSGPVRPTRPARQPERPSAPPPVQPAAHEDTTQARARELMHLPRLGTCRSAQWAGRPASQGDDSPKDASLEVARDGSCELLFPNGALVRVSGPARVLVGPEGDAALLVGRGLVTVDLPPSATTPDSGLWLATPSAYLEAVQGVRLALRTFADGSTDLAVVSGHARVQVEGEAAQEGQTIALGPTHALAVSAAGELQRKPAPARLEDAAAALSLQKEPAASGIEALAKRLAAQLDQALDVLSAEQARTKQLTSDHEILAARADPSAMAAQQALAAQAAVSFRAKRLARAHAAKLAALVEARANAVPPGELALLARARATLH